MIKVMPKAAASPAPTPPRAPRPPTPPPPPSPGRTGADRARESAKAREAAGWKTLSFFVPPTVVADLEAIAVRSGERKIDILARLLDADAARLGIKGGPRG